MSTLKYKSILEFNHAEARDFFLKAESYCNIDFPKYIDFSQLISKVHKVLEGKELHGMKKKSPNSPRDYDNVNYSILNNKDGRYAWRPFQLIHPVLYISLVHKVTEESTWQFIINRFSEFSDNEKIKCLSMPVKSLSEKKIRQSKYPAGGKR